jgi:small subunit ribosomal protein S3
MTHTVHPFAHRLGIIRDWKSRWFAATPAQYRENMKIDTAIRTYLAKRLRGLYVTSVDIGRGERQVKISIKTSRPGLVIGRGGEGSAKLTAGIEKVLRGIGLSEIPSLRIDIEEVRSPESHAAIVASMVIEGLEKRMPFRRVLKQTVEKVMANRDVEGVRIAVGGRLGGAEMSRREEVKKGRVPLQTLRADIDFARENAYLPYGVIGVKVWIYRGDIFEDEDKQK